MIWIVFVTILSLISFEKQTITSFENSDKIVHFSFYFIMTSLLLKSIKNKRKYKYLIVIVLPFFYGIIIEVLQDSFTQSRKGDFYDVLANSAGIFFAVMLNKYFIKRISSSKIKKN
ncbi:VanZ family protein [Flavobacterium ponti]|uniref:VanZ family protein n=1 Tax=Flavobacterium ponti TaxID=665133 RepID=A0ABV9P5B2_9FLAO